LIKYSGGFIMIFTLLGINPSKCQYYIDHLSDFTSRLAEHYFQNFLMIDKNQQYMPARKFTMNINNLNTFEMLTDQFL